MGYSTGKVASKETINPSKRRKLTAESTSTSKLTYNDHSSSACESANSKYKRRVFVHQPENTRKFAINWVTSTGVTTNKAAKIRKQLSHDGIDISTLSQAAIYKSTFRK